MALGALQALQPVLRLAVHRLQLAAAHAAEPHLLVAVRAADAPVRAREALPLLAVAQALQAAVVPRPVDVGVDGVHREAAVGVGGGDPSRDRAGVAGGQEGNVVEARTTKDGLGLTQRERLPGSTREDGAARGETQRSHGS